MFCTNCGMPVPDGAKFCTNCGNLIDEPSSKPSGEMSPETGQARQDGAAQTRVMEDDSARTRVMEGGSPAAGGYPGAARRGAGSGPVGDTAGFSGLESAPYAQPYEESAYVGTSQQKGGRGRIVAAIVAGVVAVLAVAAVVIVLVDPFGLNLLGPKLSEISVESAPEKIAYEVGEELDPDGLVLTLTFDDKTSQAVEYSRANADDFSFDPTEFDEKGEVDVTVSYEGKETEFSVTVDDEGADDPVVEEDEEPELELIAIGESPRRTEYKVGEKLDPSGLVLTLVYDNGDRGEAAYSSSNAGDFSFDPSTFDAAGDIGVTVTYEGFEAVFTVRVEEDEKPTSGGGSTTSPSSNAYVLPDSATRLYSKSELQGLSNWELYVARNEIYARHGRTFQKDDLQSYFNSQAWYTPLYSPEEFDGMGLLNSTEQQNAATILELEQSRGSSYI